MKTPFLLAVLTCSLLAVAQQQTHYFLPADQGNSTASVLTNKDVINLLKAGLSQQVVIAKIMSSSCTFDTSPDALKKLKAAGVPNAVILEMVKAPSSQREEPAQDSASGTRQEKPTPSSDEVATDHSASRTPSLQGIVYLDCASVGSPLFASPEGYEPIEQILCGDQLEVLGSPIRGRVPVRTKSGKKGYISPALLSSTPPANKESSARTPYPEAQPASRPLNPTLPQGVLRAVAWRAVPWVTTSYYQQPGNADTDCTGSGTWFGNIWQGNASCTTQYTPAQNVPINWYHYTIYNLVETDDSLLVLACTRNWAFSKCTYLIPGNLFPYEFEKGRISIKGRKAGKDKEQSLALDIVSSQPKTSR